MRVVLTHSEGRLEGLDAALAARGFAVDRTPLVATRSRQDARTRAAAAELLELPWLLFTSRSAVEAWLELGLPRPVPQGRPRVGAVGEATAAALERVGIAVRLVADGSGAAGLARAFLRRPDAAGPVGLPQGDRARPELRAALEGAGIPCRPVTVYETVALPWPDAVPEGEAPGAPDAPDVVVLASPSAADALPDAVARAARLVTLGPTSSRAARARGWRPHEADAPTADALVALLVRLASDSAPSGPAPEEEPA